MGSASLLSTKSSVTVSASTYILSFDNFVALESFLTSTKQKCEDSIHRYEEVLGDILRESGTAAGSDKASSQEQWAQEIKQALDSKDAKPKSKPKGNDKKQKHGDGLEEWIDLDPVSVFVGRQNRGIAELYFEVISQLKSDRVKIDSAIALVGRLKAKATATGNTALTVSILNGIPSKIVVRTAGQELKKFSLAIRAEVPAVAPNFAMAKPTMVR
ncbi:MAG: hypothetical protein ABI361_05390 [Nitrososphaera sp.]|jgi:hypothetical protein